MYIPNYGSRFNFKTCQIYSGLRKKLFKSIDRKFLEFKNTFFMKWKVIAWTGWDPLQLTAHLYFVLFSLIHREAKIHTAFL